MFKAVARTQWIRKVLEREGGGGGRDGLVLAITWR